MSEKKHIVEDGKTLKVPLMMMDSASPLSISDAQQQRDAVYKGYKAGLADAWKAGQDTASSPSQVDREQALDASIAAAQAASQRVADRRGDAEEAHREMVAHLNRAWRGAA